MKRLLNKRILIASIACSSLFIFSCNDDDKEEGLFREIPVSEFSNVSVSGDLKAEFKQLGSGDEEDYRVRIFATPEQREQIQVMSDGGVLTIEADDDIGLSDSIVVEVYAGELTEIRLESDQEAVFEGDFEQESLEVVTEGHCKLNLLGLKVDNLVCSIEGESELILTTYSETLNGDQAYAGSGVTLLNESTIQVGDSLVVSGDSVKLAGSAWIVYGDEVVSAFLMSSCQLVTEGNTTVDAAGAPAIDVEINLEGTSEAMVFAVQSISGQGEGESILYHTPVLGLDILEFSVLENAQILTIGENE